MASTARRLIGLGGRLRRIDHDANHAARVPVFRRLQPAQRRRRSTATLDCGMCRPPKCSRTVSGRSADIGAARTSSRVPTLADFAGNFCGRPRGSGGGVRVVPGRHAHRRDTRPVFIGDPTFGGVIDRYPLVNQYWTGDNLGDLYVGAKVNLWSSISRDRWRWRCAGRSCRRRRRTSATARESGRLFDFIASKELAKVVEASGYAGYEFRAIPTASTCRRRVPWGAGAAFPRGARCGFSRS